MKRADSDREWEPVRRNWKQLLGAIHERWKRLPEARLAEMDGSRAALRDALRAAYGISREEADAQLDAFVEANGEYFDPDRGEAPATPISPPP